MPRSTSKPDDLATIAARRDALKAELAALDERSRELELAARDAGRPVLLAALEKIKIATLEKADAKTIAVAIDRHGGKAVADHLASLS